MDRRSWLWRRRSSEKSSGSGGETESSGSLSSHSERFFDDQALANHIPPSNEVTSKAPPSDEEFNDTVKTLSEKLSAALLNIHAKEDLVKQHAQVAEEAVMGWERAENENFVLKKQVEVLTQKNSVLEERVGSLDRALKECLRKLRQEREEQEAKIYDAVAKKTSEWESTKSELENQLVRLHSQLQNANTDAITSTLVDVRSKLEAAEKENSLLKLELLSKAAELKSSNQERDLSTRAAETTSKQNLESLKKVTSLEAECRRLKAVARRATPPNDHRSLTASSVYVESFTDNRTDSGERLLAIQSDCCRSVDINLMDDFLEMERLAALPEIESGSSLETEPKNGENPLKADLEAMTNRTAELEEHLVKMEAEKVSLEIALRKCQDQLKISRDQLKETSVKLVDMRSQLAMANEAKRLAQIEVEDTNIKLKKSEKLLEDADVKFQKLENEISRKELDSQIQKSTIIDEFRINQDKEMTVAATKFAECQKTIASLGRQLKSLAALEDFLTVVSDSERQVEIF